MTTDATVPGPRRSGDGARRLDCRFSPVARRGPEGGTPSGPGVAPPPGRPGRTERLADPLGCVPQHRGWRLGAGGRPAVRRPAHRRGRRPAAVARRGDGVGCAAMVRGPVVRRDRGVRRDAARHPPARHASHPAARPRPPRQPGARPTGRARPGAWGPGHQSVLERGPRDAQGSLARGRGGGVRDGRLRRPRVDVLPLLDAGGCPPGPWSSGGRCRPRTGHASSPTGTRPEGAHSARPGGTGAGPGRERVRGGRSARSSSRSRRRGRRPGRSAPRR
jgi:hypothetical protein